MTGGAQEPSLPTIGGFVQLPQSWDSSAGKIQNLVEHAVGGVGIIHSRAGSSRAGHHHLQDYHYLFCLSGEFRYTEWAVGEKLPDTYIWASSPPGIVALLVGPGQMIFTPPMRNHLLWFREDTVLVSISKLNRTHTDHERDVVRL